MILDDILTQTSATLYEGEVFTMEYDEEADLWVLVSAVRIVYGKAYSRYSLARFFGLTLIDRPL